MAGICFKAYGPYNSMLPHVIRVEMFSFASLQNNIFERNHRNLELTLLLYAIRNKKCMKQTTAAIYDDYYNLHKTLNIYDILNAILEDNNSYDRSHLNRYDKIILINTPRILLS